MSVATFAPAPPSLPGFRAVPLDGALLYFHPATGTHVRIANPATAELRRAAPRVVMFGITNACNLECDFCSRDRQRPSRWTAASAATVLRDLAAAGTLEVAFGGGEPFVFPGFRELLAELQATTPLAVHVTTNGTRIDATTWPAFAGLLAMVRLSIYEDAVWQRAAAVLSAAGQLWGANLLVDDAALARLPERLAELAAAGCGDVSILTFVGADPARQLSSAGRVRLATMLEHSPLPVRLSVCAGGSIPVATLPHGLAGTGDCGAGLDFLSISPDQTMQACSFQDGPGMPARTAEEILTGWRTRQERLSQASPRHGCARGRPVSSRKAETPPIAIWRSYSGNNSGECVVVAQFATVAAAEQHLATLLPGWKPGEGASAEWAALFARESLEAAAGQAGYLGWSESLSEMLVIGRSVLAIGYGADDELAPLRALAWRQGARVSPGGVHLHGPLCLLAAIRCRDGDDARERAATCADGARGLRAWVHGNVLLVIVGVAAEGASGEEGPFAQAKAALTALAGERPCAVEVLEAITDEQLLTVKQRLAPLHPPTHSRVVASFWGRHDEDRARAFVHSLGSQPTVIAGRTVLVEAVERPKRLAVLACRHGAHVTVLDESEIQLNAGFWFMLEPRRGAKAEVKRVPVEAVRALFTPGLLVSHLEVESRDYDGACNVSLRTTDPGPIMRILAQYSDSIGCRLNLHVSEVDPLASALRRVLADTAYG